MGSKFVKYKNLPYICYFCKKTETSKWFFHREKGKIVARICRSCYRNLHELATRYVRTGSRRRVFNTIEKRCYSCGTLESTGDWMNNYDFDNPHILLHVLCYSCYKHLLSNPRMTAKERAENPYRHYMKQLNGKFKEIKKDTLVRTGRCSLCPNNIFDGSCKVTNIHHWIYDEDHTLDYTQEVCVSCHTKIENSLKRFS